MRLQDERLKLRGDELQPNEPSKRPSKIGLQEAATKHEDTTTKVTKKEALCVLCVLCDLCGEFHFLT